MKILAKGKGQTTLEIDLREGRKRQIRRMLAHFGHEVTKLRRVRFGPVELADLPEGAWRELADEEVASLRRAVGLAGERAGASGDARE